jgi:catechol 2,3-dioxygenase-like lactoylglutathione lyase family enzyme
MATAYDRKREDVGNIIALEHVNLAIPDQQLATAFYIAGLGFTRDPFLFPGLENMWVNIGRSQCHLPSRGTQRLRGTIGIVVPDLKKLAQRLDKIAPRLANTEFSYTAQADRVEATCPWGNRFRCHAPSPEFGTMELGMPYVEFDVPRGAADGIVRFYRELIGATAVLEQRGGAAVACVDSGPEQKLLFRETDAAVPEYDNHHIQIYIADFSRPHAALLKHGLITEESNAHQYRFRDIVDPASSKLLYTIEHEVRSLTNPLYARPLINRNPDQTNNAYIRGQDSFRGTY